MWPPFGSSFSPGVPLVRVLSPDSSLSVEGLLFLCPPLLPSHSFRPSGTFSVTPSGTSTGYYSGRKPLRRVHIKTLMFFRPSYGRVYYRVVKCQIPSGPERITTGNKQNRKILLYLIPTKNNYKIKLLWRKLNRSTKTFYIGTKSYFWLNFPHTRRREVLRRIPPSPYRLNGLVHTYESEREFIHTRVQSHPVFSLRNNKGSLVHAPTDTLFISVKTRFTGSNRFRRRLV